MFRFLAQVMVLLADVGGRVSHLCRTSYARTNIHLSGHVVVLISNVGAMRDFFVWTFYARKNIHFSGHVRIFYLAGYIGMLFADVRSRLWWCFQGLACKLDVFLWVCLLDGMDFIFWLPMSDSQYFYWNSAPHLYFSWFRVISACVIPNEPARVRCWAVSLSLMFLCEPSRWIELDFLAPSMKSGTGALSHRAKPWNLVYHHTSSEISIVVYYSTKSIFQFLSTQSHLDLPLALPKCCTISWLLGLPVRVLCASLPCVFTRSPHSWVRVDVISEHCAKMWNFLTLSISCVPFDWFS